MSPMLRTALLLALFVVALNAGLYRLAIATGSPLWFWTAAIFVEVPVLVAVGRWLTCHSMHKTVQCAAHAKNEHSRRCMLIDFFTLGTSGHDYLVLDDVRIELTFIGWWHWPIPWWCVIARPEQADDGTTVYIPEPDCDGNFAMRRDLPRPAKMTAICKRCNYLWIGPSAQKLDNIIERIASMGAALDR